ncbi:MAG: DNA polymerase III subunit delta' [Gammaproteobacteria bacterium]
MSALLKNILPWQTGQWQTLTERINAGSLPHALLLSGMAGLGKSQFAEQLAQGLLCHSPENNLPCGQCRSCQLLKAETHPDIRHINVPADKKIIGVGQIRELGDYLSLKAQYEKYRVVIINPADRMNVNASNSLLKTLEEPPPDTVIVLISERPALLPATIRSRCQKISFAKPDRESAIQWLENCPDLTGDPQVVLDIAGGAPLAALSIAADDALQKREMLISDLEGLLLGREDPVLIGEKWLKLDTKTSLYWLYGWIVDMIRLKVSSKPPGLNNSDMLARLKTMSERLETQQLFKRLDRVNEVLRVIEGQLNQQLLLEDVLLTWISGVKPDARAST